MLNLLIAIVSDEFEQFMGRADLEEQLALAGICEDARHVLQVQPVLLYWMVHTLNPLSCHSNTVTM